MNVLPPSLAPEVLTRAFRAADGELAFDLSDIDAFLDACEADGITVPAWEFWLIDHYWDREANAPRPSPQPGYWCDLIPIAGEKYPRPLSGDVKYGSIRDELSEELAFLETSDHWKSLIRVHFMTPPDTRKPVYFQGSRGEGLIECDYDLPQPRPYFAQLDEYHFFAWLQGIDSIVAVRHGPRNGLTVTIRQPINRWSFYDLVALFRRYGLDQECLRPLWEDHYDPAVRDFGLET